ncbi:MarR family transcriptional regulator [Mycolicibacterium sp. P1-18]|uniref:MarR family winged helix-turn-helix transcriptional regulator n=1 Tax=Mycolicibacterium sp. P1-18 TaxID=2024615 RepID=UPI0011F0F691|nr:MarR family transcriptional regulator [Mycolicibacterium sp. P1-18]KAA0096061.1 MarR family transcriptional regulator [Mycolicibacterium sp. P1-18]
MADTDAPELRLLDGLYRLNKLVVADARVHVAATAHLDLVDFLVLRTVKLGVDTPSDLVSDLGLNPSVLSRSLSKLADSGLVTRQIELTDSRRSRIRLTDNGVQTTDDIGARLQPSLAQRLRLLTPDQTRILLESLEILCGDTVT